MKKIVSLMLAATAAQTPLRQGYIDRTQLKAWNILYIKIVFRFAISAVKLSFLLSFFKKCYATIDSRQ